LIPPGGRLGLWEFPHEAVARCLVEEAGIGHDQFEFDPRFHKRREMISNRVMNVPQPYAVHQEHRLQRKEIDTGNCQGQEIQIHYAFLYVCRFRGVDLPLEPVRQYRPQWYSLKELEAMGEERPFDDVFRDYAAILNSLDSHG
jgi:hypothetical protein